MEIEALNPGKGSCSSVDRRDPFPRRLSRHLDSASYRTLLRIFSLCLDDDDETLEPLRGARQDAVPKEGCEAPQGESGGKDATLDQLGGRNLVDDRGNGGLGDLGGNSSGVFIPMDRFESDPGTSQLGDVSVRHCPVKEVFAQSSAICHHHEQCISVEVNQRAPIDPSGMMADAYIMSEGLGVEPSKTQVDDPKDKVSYLANESDQNHDKGLGEINHLIGNQMRPSSHLPETEELAHGKLVVSNNGDINNGLDKEVAPDKIKTTEGHNEAFNFNSETIDRIDSSGFMKLDMNLLNQLLDSDDDDDIEEGQIPDEFYSSDLLVEQLDQNMNIKEQVSRGSSSCDFSKEEDSSTSLVYPNGLNMSTSDITLTERKCKEDELSRLLDVTNVNAYAATSDISGQAVTGNALESTVAKLRNIKSSPNSKVVEVQEKKRRKLTEERKAKKKKAKKRKRAEKERKQGVKRLKLQPITKTKVVQHCTFYLKGRCEQGDLCKFSHDTTPLTKSVACKYFVTGSCLRGDDCPYDHNLSKYPCHLFLASGTCIRGDKCKFSHKISENASSAAVVVSPIPLLAAEKLSMGKHKAVSNTSAPVTEVHKGIPRNAKENCVTSTSAIVFYSPKSISPSMKSSMHEQLPGTSTKAPTQRPIPSGISFLSFGSGSSINHKDKLEKNCSISNCSQQNLDKFSMSGHVHYTSLTGKPLPKAESACGSKSIQTEVSDASKILEEFLFGVGN